MSFLMSNFFFLFYNRLLYFFSTLGLLWKFFTINGKTKEGFRTKLKNKTPVEMYISYELINLFVQSFQVF